MHVFIKQFAMAGSSTAAAGSSCHAANNHAVNNNAANHHAIKKTHLSVLISLALAITPALAELPVPSANFVHAGDAAYLFNAARLTINQHSDSAILNWQSFNVGVNNSVIFKQPDSSSIALNRIFQQDPSKILGTINANGQVYLYNQNGFVFGENVRFNANNIVATTLNVEDHLIMNSSILNAIENQQAAFFYDANNNNINDDGDAVSDSKIKIDILPGAQITAETILMIAPEIVNQGILNSADGQTILAASKDKVYLAASDNSTLRGLLVEVATGGTVTNAGSISAERGNVTLIGYAVNQNGRIRATTSVNKNGSIRLLARDNAEIENNNRTWFNNNKESIGVDDKPTAEYLAQAKRSGRLVLAENSLTEIAVDSDTVSKVPDAQQQLKSKVEMVGKQLWLKRNSKIIAPSAQVNITATATPDKPTTIIARDSYVYMDKHSIIDVSGVDTAILPMARNSVAVEVRAIELADAALQRDGVLRAQTVYVDLRKGTELLDYSGAVAVIEKSVAERLSEGGIINIHSAGDFVQREGALLDVSGGKLSYEDGFIRESKLVSQGQVISLSDADKLRRYDAILGGNSKWHDRWAVNETFFSNSAIASSRFVTGFVEGKDAGKVNITAASAIMANHGIKADSIIGRYQTPVNMLPKRGELNINLKQFIDSTQNVSFALESTLDAITDDIAKAPGSDMQRDNITVDLVLPDSYLHNSAIGKLTVNTSNEVVIEAAATLQARPASEINLGGSTVIVNGNIINHGGVVKLSAEAKPGDDRAGGLLVADNAVIDVSGIWVNNSGFASDQASAVAEFIDGEFIDGGDINLFAEADISIGEGALLSASAGALLDTEFNLAAGRGGNISLTAKHREGTRLTINGKLEGYAMHSGGSLHLESSSVLLGDDVATAADDNQLLLASSLFSSGGFSRYKVVANDGDLVIDTVITPVMTNLVLNDSVAIHPGVNAGANVKHSSSTLPLIATGTAISEIMQQVILPDFERQPVALDFRLQQIEKANAAYNLSITERAQFNLDPGSQLSFNSDTSILHAGKINAPAADVSFTTSKSGEEPGFFNNQAIWLADGSVIDVSSTASYENNDQGLRSGKVFDAGSVLLTAKRGYVIIEEGARIDVSAKAETLDMLLKTAAGGAKYQAVKVAADAGQIAITAAEGIVLDGELLANAASVSGARGGELALQLNAGNRNISDISLDADPFNYHGLDIVVADISAKRLHDDAVFGDVIGDVIDGNLQAAAYLDIGKVKSAGFDTVKLKTRHVRNPEKNSTSASEIRFASDVDFSLPDTMVLSAPIININDNDVQLTASYVALGAVKVGSVASEPVAGSQQFSVDAALIDIIGDVMLTNTAAVNLNASNDIRFIGKDIRFIDSKTTGSTLTAALSAAANINLNASQIYPTTLIQASIDLINKPAATLSITANGVATATPVLSAFGSLSINAPNIVQAGVIKAPLGNISLHADESITLLPGSLTSISAEDQIIPFGETRNAGNNWIYNVGFVERKHEQLADKSIELNSANIDMQKDSVVDISGGGDIFAYEFVAGPGGSIDTLLADNGAFAILPDSARQYVSYDPGISNPMLSNDSNSSNIGQQIYLEAGKDFAAGFYSILPARYAMLPGAKLVTPLSNDRATNDRAIFPGESLTRIDGAQILAGRYATANTDIIDSLYSAFVVEDGSVVHTRSEYIMTSANEFFTANLPADAGALIINTGNSLSLAGSIRGERAAGAKGSRLDILADNIEVIASGTQQTDGFTDGFIQLHDTHLNQLAVDSLMLGGRRRIADDETTVSVHTDNVIIRANASLELPEILLLAKEQISTQSGSVLSARGVAGGNVAAANVANSDDAQTFVLDNNAAIVGVTVNQLAVIKRADSNVAAGSINLAQGSELKSDNSIFINSANEVDLQAKLLLADGNLALAAKKISFGTVPVGAADGNTAGLNLSAEMITALSVDKLEINSLESLTFFEDINLAFNNLAIIAPGINAQSDSAVNVQLTASGDILLAQNGVMAHSDGSGNGLGNDLGNDLDNSSFNINAQNIILAGNEQAFLFTGFNEANFNAGQSVASAGFAENHDHSVNNVFDFANASVVFDTPLFTGETGSKLTLNSLSDVSLINTTATLLDAAEINALGAEFIVNAAKVDVATNIIFPSGFIAFNAHGSANTDSTSIADGGYIDVSGRTVNYLDGSQAGSSGGLIKLSSASADVITAANSVLNISAASVAGDAGAFAVSAVNATAILSGKFEATHTTGFAGGSIRVDVDHVADVNNFMQSLQAGNFTYSQNYRIRNGNIDIAVLANNATNIKASEIILTADNGAINLSGKLDASGKQAGRIELYASGNIDITAAIMDVFATDSKKGGELLIASSNSNGISADGSTQINMAGNKDGMTFDSGKLTLRAKRNAANNDVLINDFSAAVTGAERIDIEAVAIYNDAVISNAQQTVYKNDAADWLANKDAIATRLGLAGDNRVHFLPGVEVTSAGNITISDAVDFYQWQLDSADVIAQGNFTVRAGNDLNINAAISDAVNDEVLYSFSMPGFTMEGPIVPVIKNGNSWNYRLLSGADLSSANIMATTNDGIANTGDLRLAKNVAIRTGKGDINIASGGDLILAEQSSVIYTVGQGNGTGRFDAMLLDMSALLPDGPQFPDQGGDIRIAVAGDINAASSDQFFTDWLQRVGGTIPDRLDEDPVSGMWGVVIKDFAQGIATLGGGDIDIVAGGNISRLSVSTPQSGQIDNNNELVIRGGGNITMAAGGDIRSARILADAGVARLRARGNVTADSNGLNTLVALGDARAYIEAAGDIDIEGIANVTMLPLSSLQLGSNANILTKSEFTSYFFSYSERSAVSLLSYYGDITLNNDIDAIKRAPSNRLTQGSRNSVSPWRVYPGIFNATSLLADIVINDSFALFPNANGNLKFLAANNIISRPHKSLKKTIAISVSDVAISSLPSIADPMDRISGGGGVSDTATNILLSVTNKRSLMHDLINGPLRINDDRPLRMVANNNITGIGELILLSPKQTQIIAGGNITDFSAEIQNILKTDKSMMLAGGDISYSMPVTGAIHPITGIRVTGPGSMTVMAAGNINLGVTAGIRSLGNVDNPLLPEQGADIAVFAGIENSGLNQEFDTSAFIATYFKGEPSADTQLIDINVTSYQQQLLAYVLSDQYKGDLTQAVAALTGQTYANNDAAITALKLLDESQQIAVAINSYSNSKVSEQRKLIIDVFVAELNLAAESQAKTKDDSEYARGFLAINRLFAAPGKSILSHETSSNETMLATARAEAGAELAEDVSLHGDISLPFSRIQSLAGGDINIFAPHGDVTVGFTADVENTNPRLGSLGVVIAGMGDLSIMSQGDIHVNQSRVQALDGGDISLWTSTGNIDAGRGAKTALTVPPPLTVFDKNTGQMKIIFPPAVSGSGINAGVTSEGMTAGRVILAAPGGIVDAADAGIGSAGDLIVAASKVLGADNFSVAGTTVGVPVATNVTAGLSGLSSAADTAVSSASEAATAAATAAAESDAGVALVTVELLVTPDAF